MYLQYWIFNFDSSFWNHFEFYSIIEVFTLVSNGKWKIKFSHGVINWNLFNIRHCSCRLVANAPPSRSEDQVFDCGLNLICALWKKQSWVLCIPATGHSVSSPSTAWFECDMSDSVGKKQGWTLTVRRFEGEGGSSHFWIKFFGQTWRFFVFFRMFPKNFKKFRKIGEKMQ